MKFGLNSYTMDAFFEKVVDTYATLPSLASIGEAPFTYHEFGQRVKKLKNSLRSLGVQKTDKVIILGSSSPNWAIAYMAITTMGAVAVPVLEGFPDADIDHIINHSGASAIFISHELFQSLTLLSLEKIPLVFNLNDNTVLLAAENKEYWKSLAKLTAKEKESLKLNPKDKVSGEIKEDDLAEILYTSGTTGHSKGVMLSHGNIVSNVFEGPDILGAIHTKSVVLSILPMAHAFGCTSAFLSIIYCGASIYYLNRPPSPKVLLNAMQEVKPTILGAVPLVFEKIYYKQVLPIIRKSSILPVLIRWDITKKLLYRLIGKKVKQLLGGHLECVIIGGAAFSHEVEIFMQYARIPYSCGYGLSECSPLVTFASMEEQKIGSPGHAITDVNLKIIEKDAETGVGEICIKGPNVMQGYYKDKQATQKAFTKDGWFISGDKGYIDEDGFLFITGRTKNVIIGPSGENIYPEIIEAKLQESLFVEEAIVYQQDKQIAAKIYPDYGYIENAFKPTDEQALAAKVSELLEEVRIDVNAQLAAFSKINKVIEQTTPFAKTPTNKIKRREHTPG